MTRLQADDRRVLLFSLLVTAGTLLFSVYAYIVHLNQFPREWAQIWYEWDARHFATIAQKAYSGPGGAEEIAWAPFFPLLIRVWGAVTGDFAAATAWVSNLAFFAAAWVFFRWASFDYGKETAYRALAILAFYPTAYFFHVGYSEPVFVALAAGCLLSARKERWLLAGSLGSLAILTRLIGLALVPALAAEAWLQMRERGSRRPSTDAVAGILVAASGFAIFLALNVFYLGDAWAFGKALNHGGKGLAWPWVGLWHAVTSISWRSPQDFMWTGLSEAVFGVALWALAALAFRRLRLSHAVFIAVCALECTANWSWLSVPRYHLSAFPVMVVLASYAWPWEVALPAAIVSAMFQGFLLGSYVVGVWAF